VAKIRQIAPWGSEEREENKRIFAEKEFDAAKPRDYSSVVTLVVVWCKEQHKRGTVDNAVHRPDASQHTVVTVTCQSWFS